MHLDGLQKNLAAFLRKDPSLQPLAEVVEAELTLVNAVLQTGDAVTVGLWFDSFIGQHPDVPLLNSSEVREQFVAAARTFRPVFEETVLGEVGLDALQEESVNDPFRPSYISAADTPVVNEQAIAILDAYRKLPEGSQDRVLTDLAQEFRARFDRAEHLKPATLEKYRAVNHVIAELTDVLTQATEARTQFQGLLSHYPALSQGRSPSSYHLEMLEPVLFTWGDLLQAALGKFKQVEAWQENAGTSTQRQKLGELWLQFAPLRSDWASKRGGEGHARVLQSLAEVARGSRLLQNPADGKPPT